MLPRLHVAEAAQPDEAIRIVEIAVLTDDAHADRLLPFDEVIVEDVHEHVALAWMQRVLAQLEDRVGRLIDHALEDPAVWIDAHVLDSGRLAAHENLEGLLAAIVPDCATCDARCCRDD